MTQHFFMNFGFQYFDEIIGDECENVCNFGSRNIVIAEIASALKVGRESIVEKFIHNWLGMKVEIFNRSTKKNRV